MIGASGCIALVVSMTQGISSYSILISRAASSASTCPSGDTVKWLTPGRVAVAFTSAAAADTELPTTRRRSIVKGCRDVSAADMVRNDRLATVEVTADGREVRVDGEVVGIEAVAEVALSGRYLLG